MWSGGQLCLQDWSQGDPDHDDDDDPDDPDDHDDLDDNHDNENCQKRWKSWTCREQSTPSSPPSYTRWVGKVIIAASPISNQHSTNIQQYSPIPPSHHIDQQSIQEGFSMHMYGGRESLKRDCHGHYFFSSNVKLTQDRWIIITILINNIITIFINIVIIISIVILSERIFL